MVTIGAFDVATDMYRDWMYQGGIPIQGFLNSWLFGSVLLQHMGTGLSITDHGRAQVIYDMYDHSFDDAWQRRRSPFWELDQVAIPVLSIGAWGKASLHLGGNFEGFRLVKGAKRLLIVGAKTFAETQILYFKAEFHRAELLPWYDHHLKGVDNGVMDRPKVRFLTQGEEAEHSATNWPPPDVVVSELFLSGAKSNHEASLNDDSLVEMPSIDADRSTSWTYPDPQWMAGVTTIDTQGIPHHVAAVVTYTSAPFDHDREFTGQGVLHLHASSDQTDMDVMVKLSLLPEGEGKPPFIKVSQGWLRASRRVEHPDLTTEMRPFLRHDRDEPISPHEIYDLRIELIPMSVLVRAGERLRLEISNWKSAQTEAPMTHWYGQKVGTDTYHHDAVHPSRLRLHERPRRAPQIVESFAQATRNARAAGFDGVELHGANGYLQDQFLQDGSNKRADAYGGSVENRARLMLETTAAMIGAWSAERVGVRLSPSSFLYGVDDSDKLATFGHVVRALDAMQIGYLCLLEPNAKDAERGVQIEHVASTFRPMTSVPIIVNTGFDKTKANTVLAAGDADLVAFGVPYIANPDLVARLHADAPLNKPDPSKFYGEGSQGYTDYSALAA